jgi:hypothetical protein
VQTQKRLRYTNYDTHLYHHKSLIFIAESQELMQELDSVIDLCLSPIDGHVENVTFATTLATMSGNVIDVTIPVQCLVEESSRLVLYEGSKSGLAGFYDLLDEEDAKHLLIRYSYQGQLHQVVIGDLEQVRCPRNAHQLPEL